MLTLQLVSKRSASASHGALGRRLLAASVVVLLGTAGVGGAYCPMRPRVGTTADQARPHDCCKKGVTGATPRCCHAASSTEAVALLKSPPLVMFAAAASVRIPSVATEPAAADAPATSALPAHSPPPRVLRI